MKVNLGCGSKMLQGWVNLDKYDVYPIDVVHDLETFPYPFETGSCTEILMNHVLEHLGADAEIFNGVVKELHRICKHDARLYINVPHPRHDTYLSDPTHVRPINPDVLRLYDQTLNKEWEKSNVANTPLGILCGVNFVVESTHYVLEEKYQEQVAQGKISEEEVWVMISERNNIAREIQIIWKAVKL